MECPVDWMEKRKSDEESGDEMRMGTKKDEYGERWRKMKEQRNKGSKGQKKIRRDEKRGEK